jgi:hypothetical protein
MGRVSSTFSSDIAQTISLTEARLSQIDSGHRAKGAGTCAAPFARTVGFGYGASVGRGVPTVVTLRDLAQIAMTSMVSVPLARTTASQ